MAVLLAAAAVLPADQTVVTLPTTLAEGVVGLTMFGQVLMWATLAVVHARLSDESVRDSTATADGRVGHSAGGD